MKEILSFKEAFYKDQKRLHLNNAGLSPISRPAQEKIKYWADRFFEDGFYSDAEYMQEVLNTRIMLSKILGTNPDEISFHMSTAYAISQLALELELKSGDEILMFESDYGSNLYPWLEAQRRTGATVNLVPTSNFKVNLDDLVSKINPRTKVVAVSWLMFQTGQMIDLLKLGEACKRENIFFFVDVMQGLGLHPFHMKKFNINACAGGSHKWLVSPVGVGFLALDEFWTAKIRPHNFGSSTYGSCDDPSSLVCAPKKDGTKYEAGSKQVLEIVALGASLELILKTKVENIEKEVLSLSKKLHDGLVDLKFEVNYFNSSIVNFIPKADTEKRLLDIPCLFARRGPGLRLSPHAHNSMCDIDKVLNSLS